MVYRRKGFVVINFLITLNVQQRWFLNGIEDGFRGVEDKALVKRMAKVIFFCHISNGRSSFTNPHLLYLLTVGTSLLVVSFQLQVSKESFSRDQQRCVCGNEFCCNSFTRPILFLKK